MIKDYRTMGTTIGYKITGITTAYLSCPLKGLLIVLTPFPRIHCKPAHQHSPILMKFLLLPEPYVSHLPSVALQPRCTAGSILTPPPR